MFKSVSYIYKNIEDFKLKTFRGAKNKNKCTFSLVAKNKIKISVLLAV